ncbi:hypothetical protein D9M69_708050 [compost metagenome]
MPSGSFTPSSAMTRSSRPSVVSSAICGGRLITVKRVPVSVLKVSPEVLRVRPWIGMPSMATW